MKKIISNFLILLFVSLPVNITANEDGPRLPRVAEDSFDDPNVTYNVVDGQGLGGYNPGFSGGAVPMGGIGFGASPYTQYPGAGYGGFNTPMNGGMPQVALDESGSCPFNNQSEDVRNIWQSTRDVLTQIQNQDTQNSQSCGLIQANSATLQQALQTYEQQRYRTVDGDGSASSAVTTRSAQLSGRIVPDCENYESLYQNEYEQILSLVSRNFELSAMPGDYHSACSQYYPTDPDNFSYSAEFRSCLADTLAQKIEVAHIECDGKSEFLDDIENQRNTFRAQQEALLAINSAISNLSSNLHTCSNRDMVRSSLRSIINVGTMIASPAVGGIEGVFAAFGGSILDNIVGLLFRSQASADLAEMDREDRYIQTACLFYNAERLKCAANSSTLVPYSGSGFGYPYPYGPCGEDNRPPNTVMIQELIDTLMSTISRMPSGRKAAELSRFLNQPLSSDPDTTNLEFMQDPVLRTLRENSLYEDAANLESFINQAESLVDLNTRLQSGEQSASAEVPHPNPPENNPNAQVRAYEALRILEDSIYQTDFASSLYSFTQIGQDGGADNVARYREYANQITEQFYEQQRSAISNWRNSRQLDMAMSAMVNNLQEDHEERLETHFRTDLQTAIALSGGEQNGHNTRDMAFNQLSGIINDCMYMEGMHTYQRVDLDSDARSTSQVEPSSTYNRYCENFSCVNNFNKFHPNGEEMTAVSFANYQCAKYTTGNWNIETMRNEFIRDGKICGKTLEEIFSEGTSRRRR